MSSLRIVDIVDETGYASIPPCADARFDHRTCDYWEDAEGGSKRSRPDWLTKRPASVARPRPPSSDNPFAPSTDPSSDLAAALRGTTPPSTRMLSTASDVFAGDDLFATPAWNPFAPGAGPERPRSTGVPRKFALLDRGRGIFGSYARVAYLDDEPVAYAQFGPLSAYPRARHVRELYPQLPSAPPPSVITCIATTQAARGAGHARELVLDICSQLALRGFSAVEAYPDLTLPVDEASAASPPFWLQCGFTLAATDERYPVMRRELD